MPSITEYWKPLAEDVSTLAFLHLFLIESYMAPTLMAIFAL